MSKTSNRITNPAEPFGWRELIPTAPAPESLAPGFLGSPAYPQDHSTHELREPELQHRTRLNRRN